MGKPPLNDRPRVLMPGPVITFRMIEVTVNGAPRRLKTVLSVAQLLESEGLAGKRVAVERNGEIVPRSCHPETLVAGGDRIEIVVAVGGG